VTLPAFKNPCRPGWRIFSQPAVRKGLKSIKHNKDDSAFAQHILNTGQYGPIEQIMEKIEGARKGRMMNIKENFYIY
jgi:hypothetical protein